MDEIDDWDRGKSFQVRILLRHPTMHPDVVTKALSIQPYGSNSVGEPRTRPDKQRLPGLYRETVWAAKWTFIDTRFFFRACMKVFSEAIEPHIDFMRGFVETGGRAVLTVDAKGSINIGDVLSARDLYRLSLAGVDIGLEVFPGE